jgi:hypothetical protein
VAVTEYDADWYYELAQAARHPVWTQLAFCLPASIRRPASNAQDLWISSGLDAKGVPSRMIL